MNLILKAEWPLSPIDKNWLDGYVRNLLHECAEVMRVVYPEMPAAPVDAFTGELIVTLYGNLTPWGSAGNYIRNYSEWGLNKPGVKSELAISWYWHWERKHRVIQFEGRNFWNDMMTGRGSFAHPMDPGWGCPLIDKMKTFIEAAYHPNIDNPLPDVYLCHVDAPGVRL